MLILSQYTGLNAGGGITPPDVAGLEFWVRADLGITKDGSDLVSQWNDQSGNGRNLTQGTGAAQPLYVASGVNSQPIVRFDGSNDLMQTASFSPSAPVTIFTVIKCNSATTGMRWYNTRVTVADGITLRVTGATSNAVGEGNGAAGTIDTTNFYLWTAITASGTSSKLARNDGAQSTSANAVVTTIAGVTLGAYSAGVGNSAMDIAEMCMYNSEISGSSLAALLDYFNSRYALW